MATNSSIAKETVVGIITHNSQGGAQQALSRLFDGLSRRGYQASLWYLYRRGTVEISDLPCQFVLEKENPTAFDYCRIAFRLFKMLAQTRPTAVISFLPLANVLGQTLAWTCRIPIRVASQRNPVQTYGWAMQLLDWYFGTSGSYTHNVVNSSDVELSVSHYPWPYRYRTQIIHNGVEPPSALLLARTAIRSRFGVSPDDVVLASIGRLTKQKNQIFLIQILGALKNFKLLLAGSGPEQSRLALEARRMGVADRVSFLGTLDQSNTNALLQAADIFALPSLYEGHSNALLEAMATGRPVVTSDIPSHCETLLGGRTEAGLAIPITDPNQWIAALSRLGANPQQRRELGDRAKRRVGDFTLENMCSAFESIIRSRSTKAASATAYSA